LAETGDRRIDQARIGRMQGRMVEAEPRHDAGAEILDEDVGLGGEGMDEGEPLGLAHIHRDAALAAVEEREIGALALDMRSEMAALIAAPRHLDLDDLGAEIGEHGGAIGAGHHAREIEHAQALEEVARRSAHYAATSEAKSSTALPVTFRP